MSRICFGTSWNEDRSAVLWSPLLVEFGARGPEVTADQMLEGGGHTFLELEQLLLLIAEIYPAPGDVLLAGELPEGVGSALTRCGYRCMIEG